MDKKNAIIAVLAAVAVVGIGLYVFNKPATTTYTDPETGKVTVGAVASPDINGPYMSYGSVRNWAGHTDNLAQATTTVCAIQSPAATSTLRWGGIKFVIASTTNAVVVDIAKGTNFNSTSTILGTAALAAGAQATYFVASSSAAVNTTATTIAADAPFTFGPSQWFVVALKGGLGGAAGSVPSGSCSAQWTEI